MKSLNLFLGLCLLFSSLNPISIQAKPSATIIAQSDRTRRIQFDRGEMSTTVNDSVVRGTRNIYLLRANASQIIENMGRNPVLIGRLDILYDILELPKSENQALGNAP